MRIYDLAEHGEYIEGYVRLRNLYISELMTTEITIESTEIWLKSNAGRIHCFLDGLLVVASVIVRKNGEVTIFSCIPSMGDKLLKEAEKIGYVLGLSSIWARTRKDNKKAQQAFIRNNYYTDKDGNFKKDIK